MMNKRTWRRIAIGGAALGAAILVAFALVFQDGIARFLATPRAPFQTVTPPPAPDYGTAHAWLLRPKPSASERLADAFYVHSTSYYRRARWNAPFDDEEADAIRRMIAAPNEAGPFAVIADVRAPRYREATLFAQFTHKYDGLAARELAYADVKRAFEAFLAGRDKERPIILAGYGQGGVHVLGLLRDFFQGEINPLRRRLVAAFVIGAPVPSEFLNTLSPPLPVCASATETRCLVSYVDFEARFDEEMARVRERALVWNDAGELVSVKSERLACVNPLSWTADGTYQPPEKSVGAASATGLAPGAPPAPIERAVGAKCDRGILVVDRPKRRLLRRGDWFGAKWKAQPFNLFYYDLARNAAARLAALTKRLSVEPEPLEPIGETVDLDKSPINQAPQ